MQHYVDIDVLPDPEFVEHQLMSALFAKLHRALVDSDSTGIGISFPKHKATAPTLGDRIRLHGDPARLEALKIASWIGGLRELVSYTPVLEVPGNATFMAVRRVQTKSSPERLRRRLMRRQGLDEQAARDRIPDSAAKLLKLPFIQLQSRSTEQSYRFFIEHAPAPSLEIGPFNTFGISHTATVPWF